MSLLLDNKKVQFSFQALEDLQSVESAFSDLHRRFEKTKASVENFKKVIPLFRRPRDHSYCNSQMYTYDIDALMAFKEILYNCQMKNPG